jgi:uncharacterized Zn finger protein
MAMWLPYYFYERPKRREVKGGIRAQSKRGSFGENWWAKRWIQAIERFGIDGRISRGRTYARTGKVLAVTVEKGVVRGTVQGSRSTPYQVEITVKKLLKLQWKKVAEALSREVFFTARLLAGEMPEQIEEVFAGAGLSLFPAASKDLRTSCTCPDWSNPCKHTAAVYYLVAEEFDRDPFLIFKLRGMEREELMELIEAQMKPRNGKRGRRGKESASEVVLGPPPAPEPEALPSDPAAFWGSTEPLEPETYDIPEPGIPAVLPKRLGRFPFWRGQEEFLTAMERIYRAAAPVGVNVLLGEKLREE